MIQINLLGKKRREAKGKSIATIGLIAVFGLFTLYFLGLTIYVVGKLIFLGNEIRRVKTETETVSKEIASNSELLVNFVISKSVLEKINKLNKEKFPYLDYLNQITALMPSGMSMKSVDFSVRGWVSVSAEIPTMKAFGEIEDRLTSEALLGQTAFESIFSEGVSKNQSGTYDARLQFQLKTNGGK